MNPQNGRINIFQLVLFRVTPILLFLLLLTSNTSPVYSCGEIIQYIYDNKRQIRAVTFNNQTEISYVYDTSGNRLSKTVALSGAPANNPPVPPSNIYPADSAVDIESNFELLWTDISDPDPGDVISYDIYFGASPTPPLIKSGYDDTNYSVSLKPVTTYYWKIVARDNHNAIAEGPLWSFTTEYVELFADFAASPRNGGYPLTVNFSDASVSSDQPLRYEWDFDIDGITDSIEQNPFYIYSNQGSYAVKLTVLDSIGGLNTLMKTDYITVTAPLYNLTVSTSGNGSVTSLPSGIQCGTDCAEILQEGMELTLKAIPDAGSTFAGWTGDGCTGSGDCVVVMSSDRDIAAEFNSCPNPPVRIVNKTYYTTLQTAYNDAENGDIIQSQASRFVGDLIINRDISVSLEGGYDCSYSNRIGETVLNGNIIVSKGILDGNDFILEK